MDLVVRAAVQIGDTSMHVEYGVNRIQTVFTAPFFVIDEGLRQYFFIKAGTINKEFIFILDLVDPVNTSFQWFPL